MGLCASVLCSHPWKHTKVRHDIPYVQEGKQSWTHLPKVPLLGPSRARMDLNSTDCRSIPALPWHSWLKGSMGERAMYEWEQIALWVLDREPPIPTGQMRNHDLVKTRWQWSWVFGEGSKQETDMGRNFDWLYNHTQYLIQFACLDSRAM